jgi:hypothetical protein
MRGCMTLEHMHLLTLSTNMPMQLLNFLPKATLCSRNSDPGPAASACALRALPLTQPSHLLPHHIPPAWDSIGF